MGCGSADGGTLALETERTGAGMRVLRLLGAAVDAGKRCSATACATLIRAASLVPRSLSLQTLLLGLNAWLFVAGACPHPELLRRPRGLLGARCRPLRARAWCVQACRHGAERALRPLCGWCRSWPRRAFSLC